MDQTKRSKKLGIFMSTSLVLGNMIGAGIFLMPAALAAYGGISLVGWIFSALGAFLLALIFGRLSRMLPAKEGGPYAYTKEGFGDFPGFLVAWGYWISTWVSNAAITVAFLSALTVFFPVIAESAPTAVMCGLCTIWFLTWVNSLGIRESGSFLLVVTLLKILPIILVISGGIFYFSWDNFTPLNVSGESNFEAIAITATMTLYAFLGLESATFPATNIEKPEITIPRATMIGTLTTTLLYILSTAVILGMISPEILADSPAPFADAMEIISGDMGRDIIAAGAALAAFGALHGWILVQGTLAKAIARDHLFPVIFQRENKNGIPLRGIVIGSVLTSVLLIMNFSEGLVEQFRFMILLSTMCALVAFIFSMASYLILIREKKAPRRSKMSKIILGSLAFAYAMWAIYGAGDKAVFWGFLLLLAGIPLYIYMRSKDGKLL